MRVLALDLATATGWAVGSPHGGRVSHGVIRMPKTGEDIGRFLAHFRDWLGPAIEELAPEEIVYEMPILPTTTSLQTVRKLNGLCGQAEVTARDYKVLCTEANLDDIRNHFIGMARAPKEIGRGLSKEKKREVRRRWMKDRTITECHMRGFKVAGDDDADALALLSYRLTLLNKDYRLVQVEPPKDAAEFVERCEGRTAA